MTLITSQRQIISILKAIKDKGIDFRELAKNWETTFGNLKAVIDTDHVIITTKDYTGRKTARGAERFTIEKIHVYLNDNGSPIAYKTNIGGKVWDLKTTL